MAGSFGELVREACEVQYGIAAAAEQHDAVTALAALALPVGDPATMKWESLAPSDGGREERLEAVCSYDRDFDRVAGLVRVEPFA